MNIEERVRCIKYINPQAHCIVRENGESGEVVYDSASIGKRPTLAECEVVLSVIQSEMSAENLKLIHEEKIQAEMREIAIVNLKARGDLSADFKS